jgi:uncharacterized membrane protein YfcA
MKSIIQKASDHYVVPSAIGVTAGIHLFDRIHQVRFRRLMFALLFVLGLAMCVRG